MKKIATSLFALLFCVAGFSQAYFQATMQKNENNLIFKIKPVNGDMTGVRFSALEFFVRYPTGSPAFTWGTPTIDPAFSGVSFVTHGPNTYGAEPGYDNWVFEWIAGANFVPATPTTYLQNTEYTVFSVPLLGTPNTIDMELVSNSNQMPTYLNISDYLGNSLSCFDNNGTVIGDAFYGPGFNIIAAAPSVGGDDHLLPLADVPIPVKFTSFTVEKKTDNALLTWNVENETAITDHYEMERSINGRDFSTIHRMDARVNAGSTANNYSYTDLNLKGLHSNVIYYRIKQVDKDGHLIFSQIRSVRLDGKGFGVQVYPNPVKTTGMVNIELYENQKISLLLTDATGKEIMHKIITGFSGLNNYNLDMTNLAAGTYRLKVVAGENSDIISIIRRK